MSWLEDREPNSNGITYYNWLDKYEDLNHIIEHGKYLIKDGCICDDNTLYKWINEIKQYQNSYGGLSRINM